MKRKDLLALWGGWFVICAGLGFWTGADGLGKALLVMAGVGFFVPGFFLLHQAKRKRDGHTLELIRNLAALSLGLTVVVLILNFCSVGKSEALGDVLHVILGIVSSPMLCCQYWVVSLFLWACLLIAAGKALKGSK